MPKLIDLTGHRFGRLLVIGRSETKANPHPLWLVICDCGAERTVGGPNLRSGGTRSCGCLARETASNRQTQANLRHGMTNTPIWRCWSSMLTRCTNPNSQNYARYGGRGIKIFERWLTFENFMSDMGPRPSGTTIERKDTDGNYEPSNCVWATTLEQNRNKSDTLKVHFNGETKCVAEWCDSLGLSSQLVYSRLARGWTPERALTAPPDRRFSHPDVPAIVLEINRLERGING